MARKTLAEILDGETRFGRLIAVSDGAKRGKHRTVRCLCDCGETVEVFTFSLTSGKTQSCGCWQRERQAETARVMGRNNRKHGYIGTAEYRAWNAARNRCLSKSAQAYDRYGGRGITMCPEWAEKFEAFIADMGPKPSPRHTLERVDNSRGYEPGNCEWRLWEPQNRNRRNTVMVAWRGMNVSLAKLAVRTKVSYGLLHRRIVRAGWDTERALRTPSRQA